MTRVTCTHEGHRYVLDVGEAVSMRRSGDLRHVEGAPCTVFRDGAELGDDIVLFERAPGGRIKALFYNAEDVTFVGEVDDPEALHMALDDALRDAYGLDTRRSA